MWVLCAYMLWELIGIIPLINFSNKLSYSATRQLLEEKHKKPLSLIVFASISIKWLYLCGFKSLLPSTGL